MIEASSIHQATHTAAAPQVQKLTAQMAELGENKEKLQQV